MNQLSKTISLGIWGLLWIYCTAGCSSGLSDHSHLELLQHKAARNEYDRSWIVGNWEVVKNSAPTNTDQRRLKYIVVSHVYTNKPNIGNMISADMLDGYVILTNHVGKPVPAYELTPLFIDNNKIILGELNPICFDYKIIKPGVELCLYLQDNSMITIIKVSNVSSNNAISNIVQKITKRGLQ